MEDSGDGYFLEDMDASQSASVIKSSVGGLVGEVRVYSKTEAEQLRQ